MWVWPIPECTIPVMYNIYSEMSDRIVVSKRDRHIPVCLYQCLLISDNLLMDDYKTITNSILGSCHEE